jgi:hypothetical protein
MTAGDTTVAVVNPLKQANWNQMLLDFGQGTIFHSSNWARLLAESYGYHPAYLTLTQEGVLQGCLPIMEVDSVFTGRRGVCLSFSDCCGAVARRAGEFQLLLDSVLQLGKLSGWRYVEFRGEPFLADREPVLTYAHHHIELSEDERQMHSRLRKGTSSSIRKAEKEGVTVAVSETLEAVRDFYRLHCLTRRRHGLPPQPASFFDKLHQHVIAQGLGFAVLAQYQKKTVAGLICLHFGDQAVWKYGASDEAYRHLSANNLVLWHTIKTCGQQGFRQLSLGRTDLDNEGLLSFKNGWGAVRTSLNYYRYDFGRNDFVRGGTGMNLGAVKKVLRLLPVEVLKMIGQLAYRHIG